MKLPSKFLIPDECLGNYKLEGFMILNWWDNHTCCWHTKGCISASAAEYQELEDWIVGEEF